MTRKSFYTCVTAVVAVLMMTSLHGFADPVRNYPAGADPDIMFSSGTNPAGLGFSQGLGIGFGAEIPADQDTVYNPLLVEQDTYVGFSAGSLGIAYESDGENSMFSVGQGFELLPGFSLGFATHTPSWAWSKSEFQAGTLWRPHAALSIGGIYRADIGNAWSVHPGIGLRPLALIPGLQDFGHRVTFTADAAYSEEGPSGEAYGLQRIGTQIEPLQGLRLYGGYQLSGDWNVGIEAAFGYSRNGISFALDDSVQLRSARVYSNVEVPGYPGPPATPKSRIIEFSGLQVVAEVEGLQSFGEFTFGDGSRPFTAVVEEIEELAADPSVAGILFTNPVFNGDMSHAIEIAAALQRFRQTGKTVVFSIEQADSLTYLVAALGADEIYLRPAGMLAVYGFSSSSLYFADFFDRFGINAVGFESHPSKSANHAFTESGMTEEARENTEAYLGSLFSSYLDLVAQGRGDRLAGEPAELWDDAPYLVAAQAEDAGLVDGLMYHDQVLELLEERLPEAEVMQMQTMELRNPAWHTPRRSRIAVIYAVGPIMTGEGLQGTSIGSDTLARQIREAREDDSIDAIVLRVSSGGGSALASDVIAREVYRTTRGEDPKPLVVSMGQTAASGGYYISAFADYIYAYPTTITGSIGVTSISLHLDQLLEEWDITVDGVAASESSFFLDPFRPLDEGDAEQMQDFTEAIYQQFLNTVAEGRDLSSEEADEVARGQIWTGPQALERGLVDEIGGIGPALDKAVELAGVQGPVEIYTPNDSGMLQGFGDSAAQLLLPESRIPELEQLMDDYRVLKEWSREGGVYLLPQSVRY